MTTGHRAKKSLGQHFLVDRRSAERIVALLEIRPDEPVVEIGPGKGALTGPLIRAAGRIAAVERDRDLVPALRQRFGDGIVVIHADVLRLALADLLEVLGRPPAERLVIAGNLPYNISKPLAQKMIRERVCVARAVLTFQHEVARRLVAAPGGRDYGPLSVLAGQTYEIRCLFDLPARVFRPAPAVDSTVTLWRPRDAGLTPTEEARLRSCLRACFGRRRQTLRNNLRAALGDAERADALLSGAGIDGRLRAEALAPSGFLRLAALWKAAEVD